MHSIFTSATTEAERLHSLDTYFMVAAMVVMLIVAGLATYFSLKYRHRPGDPDPEQTSSSIKTELVLLGGPALLVLAFFFLSFNTTRAVHPPAGGATPAVRVTGHQWWWQASYPGTSVQTANEIHLPVGQHLLIEGTSADVIHDWWLPGFGDKMDVIPGRQNHLWITIKQPGVYEGACSEFCGQQHAWMRIRVVAHTPADYARWLRAAAQPAAAPEGTLAQAGSALFARYACSSCHQIRGTAAHGQQGPDLTHFGSRQTMLAGLLPNNERNLARWLNNPQAVKPGAHMPRFLFAPDSIRALTTYLSHLK